MNSVYLIIPAFNESRRIESVLRGVKKYTNKIIVVNDGSTDRTANIAGKYTKWVVNHKINLGKGAAIVSGCELAFGKLGANWVILMDGDGQHLPKDLPKFFALIKEKPMLIFGIRRLDSSMPKIRVYLNKLTSLLTKLAFGTYMEDILCGFRAVSRQAFKRLKLESSSYEIEMEMAVKASQSRIPYETVVIETIYHPTDKGMNGIHALSVWGKLLSWKIGL